MEGTHFNFVKNEWKQISQTDASYYLAYQMLVGDSVDNIQGVPKIGKVKAHTLLTESDEPYMKTVWNVYKEKEMTVEQYLEHIFLLKMQKDIVYPFENHFIDFSSLADTGVIDEFAF
jgi:5'-3' exonuclease